MLRVILRLILNLVKVALSAWVVKLCRCSQRKSSTLPKPLRPWPRLRRPEGEFAIDPKIDPNVVNAIPGMLTHANTLQPKPGYLAAVYSALAFKLAPVSALYNAVRSADFLYCRQLFASEWQLYGSWELWHDRSPRHSLPERGMLPGRFE